MDALVIRSPEVLTEADRRTVSARVELPTESHDMWFRGPREVLVPRGADAFVITCLPTAMKLGLAMRVEAPTSPRLLAVLDDVQDILCKWHPDFRRVRVESQPGQDVAGPPGDGTAAFFSGGVDSFYTALKHRDALVALLLVHGFDMPLENADLRARVSAAMGRAAEALGKPLVEVETNSRPFTDRHVRWDLHQFGPALAGVAACCSGLARRVLIASAESFAHLDPNGSHVLLDPLWSTEYMTILHDGAEASRVEKVEAISGFPPALNLLRVCWENPDNAYNCGRCEKCVRTMANLAAAGALERCTAFDVPLDPGRVARVRIPSDLVAYHFEETLLQLRARAAHPALLRAVERALIRFEAGKVARGVAALPADALLRAMARHKLRAPVGRVRDYLKRVLG